MRAAASLGLGTRLRPVFAVESAVSDARVRLSGPEGSSLLVDQRVLDVFCATRDRSVVADLLSVDSEPAVAYAALNVLAHSGAVEADPPVAKTAPVVSRPSGSEPPLVSLVVVSWNSARDLPRLLASIRRQSHRPMQVIVVDNASTDGSAEIAEHAWPEISVVRQRGNDGFPAAVNAGWQLARGDLIAVLNADLELDDQAVAEWVRRAEECPEAAALAAKMMLGSNPSFINSLGNSITGSAWGSDNFMGFLDVGQFDEVVEVWAASFGAVLVRRSAIDRIGLMDPAYFLYYEDLDWCYRARLAGYSIVTAPRSVVRHQFGGSVSTKPEHFKMRLVIRNRLRYVILNMDWGLVAGFVARYLYLDARQVAKAVLRRNPHALRTYGRAYLDLLLESPRWPKLRHQRRRLCALGDEKSLLGLNQPAVSRTHVGGDAVLSEAVIRDHYVRLFPLQEMEDPQANRRRT
jgi:GT2 family glycosyltransferase